MASTMDTSFYSCVLGPEQHTNKRIEIAYMRRLKKRLVTEISSGKQDVYDTIEELTNRNCQLMDKLHLKCVVQIIRDNSYVSYTRLYIAFY